MDKFLAKTMVDYKVLFFGKNLKNKGDSCSCLFHPRNLLSSPKVLEHIGRKMALIAKKHCSSNILMGMATSGIPLAAVASIYSDIPMMYVRKKAEKNMSNKLIAGFEPKIKKVILVDDLIFAGESKNESLEILRQKGYKVSDIIVVIDRQLQRKKDGLPVEKKWELKLHSLITMTEIVDYLISETKISSEQLERLKEDYRKFERWNMPNFAK